jgi:hypothetical protein
MPCLDSRLRGSDDFSLCLKHALSTVEGARDSTIPERDSKLLLSGQPNVIGDKNARALSEQLICH